MNEIWHEVLGEANTCFFPAKRMYYLNQAQSVSHLFQLIILTQCTVRLFLEMQNYLHHKLKGWLCLLFELMHAGGTLVQVKEYDFSWYKRGFGYEHLCWSSGAHVQIT